ncbi:hypothetical protein PsYK624_122360 [Phanerochaete sordida]|uniref:Uncharacterized protein n=1 Tax=Phanerochaete sordida TaxID=48140 RepID=A0A9P3LID8_9APHY|nr:hypothetical protein PsYK624_122360 [Phanerochaete sordida]
MPSLAPARTYLLFDALAAHHALVRHLTLSARAGLTPALLLELLEALDLRSLTIHARGGLHNIQPVLIAVAHDAPLGTRLLHAIAHMPRLHTLAFTPETLAYSLALRRAVPCPGPLGARGLTALQTITDDLFPPVRAHAFWVALAAAKARPSSAPLRHLGTRLGSMGCGALARLLGACGAGLQTLRVDTRGPHLFDDGSAAGASSICLISSARCGPCRPARRAPLVRALHAPAHARPHAVRRPRRPRRRPALVRVFGARGYRKSVCDARREPRRAADAAERRVAGVRRAGARGRAGGGALGGAAAACRAERCRGERRCGVEMRTPRSWSAPDRGASRSAVRARTFCMARDHVGWVHLCRVVLHV